MMQRTMGAVARQISLDSGDDTTEPFAGREGRTMAIGDAAGAATGARIGLICLWSAGARDSLCQERGTAMLRTNSPPNKSKYGHHGLRVLATNRPSVFRKPPKRAMS